VLFELSLVNDDIQMSSVKTPLFNLVQHTASSISVYGWLHGAIEILIYVLLLLLLLLIQVMWCLLNFLLLLVLWHAAPAELSVKRWHQSPEWTILSRVNCFVQGFGFELDFRSCWIVFIHVVRGRPGGLLQFSKLLRSSWHLFIGHTECFLAYLKLISFTNPFLHSHSYSFRTDFTDLNLYCIKGALALFVLVSFSGYVC